MLGNHYRVIASSEIYSSKHLVKVNDELSSLIFSSRVFISSLCVLGVLLRLVFTAILSHDRGALSEVIRMENA
jgi:hypothetical protein